MLIVYWGCISGCRLVQPADKILAELFSGHTRQQFIVDGQCKLNNGLLALLPCYQVVSILHRFQRDGLPVAYTEEHAPTTRKEFDVSQRQGVFGEMILLTERQILQAFKNRRRVCGLIVRIEKRNADMFYSASKALSDFQRLVLIYNIIGIGQGICSDTIRNAQHTGHRFKPGKLEMSGSRDGNT